MQLPKGLKLENQDGFSLVELMIVVGIIGILATLAMPRFRQFQAKAKMGEAKNNLTHLYTLEQSYQLDNNIYLGFGRYGRLDDGSVNCAAVPANAQQIGFEVSPCTDAAAPVPRYGYQVNVTAATERSDFTAVASSGSGANNLVCPGQGAHGFSVDQDKLFSDSAVGGASALSRCF